MKATRALAALSVLTLVATLTALAPASSQAAPARGKVKVSQVAAVGAPAPSGTRVAVSFALTNTKRHATRPRRVDLVMVDARGGEQRLGRTWVPPIGRGVTRRFSATRTATNALAGAYRVKVCFPVVARGTCSTTPGAPITITPAVLTLGSDVVTVPVATSGTPSPGASVSVTNTGQAPTGTLSIALDAVAEDQAATRSADRVASTDFEVAATTTCGSSLAPGRTCQLDITRTEGSRSDARAVLTASGARGATASARVEPPVTLFLTPAGHDFGEVAVGSSRAFTFEVVNNSDAEVTMGGSLEPESDFAFDFAGPFTCLAPLPAHGSCTISVGFAPGTVGFATTTMYLFGNQAVLAPATLSGTGTSGEPVRVHSGARTFGQR